MRFLDECARGKRVTSWTRWTTFCSDHHIDPWMHQLQGSGPQPCNARSDIFLAFAESIRRGRFHNNILPGKRTVERTIREKAKVLVKHHKADPRKLCTASLTLDPDFTTLFKRHGDTEPLTANCHCLSKPSSGCSNTSPAQVPPQPTHNSKQ